MRISVRLLVLAQVSFWFFLLICCLIMPRFLFEPDEGGMSNFGVYAQTAVYYSLAFIVCGVLTLLGAHALPAATPQSRRFRFTVFLFGWLCLLTLESTYLYQVNEWFDAVHIVSNIVLFLCDMAAATWYYWVIRRDPWQQALLALQGFAFVAAVLTFAGVLHILFVVEALSSLLFGTGLIRAALQVNPAAYDLKTLRVASVSSPPKRKTGGVPAGRG